MKLSSSQFKHFYRPTFEPELITLPPMKFLTVSGQGDPNGQDFQVATEALYALSYAIKMSYRKPDAPEAYYDYTVFPLEGAWDLVDKTKGSLDKSNYAYTLMIQQPDFLTPELFERFRSETLKKKPNPRLSDVRLETLEFGPCCQMLHIGPYADEPESFKRMVAYCETQGFQRASKLHHEVYLSDPRKGDPAKLKTILRFSVTR